MGLLDIAKKGFLGLGPYLGAKAMGDDDDSIPFPEYYEDPDYRKTQDYLRDLGINVLDGKIPEYYKGIGETGGQEFENYLGLITGDIQKSALDTAAASGRGGGMATEIATKATNEAVTKSRYADFMRALEGKQWLFGQGKDITEGVRTAGAAEGGRRNNFNILGYNAAVDERDYQNDQDALAGQNFGQLLDLGINAGVGFATGGPVGALAGAMGGADWSSIFNNASSTKSAAAGTTEAATSLSKRGKIKFGGANINLDDYLT